MDLYPQAGRPYPLLIKLLLERPLSWAPDQKIIYRDIVELTYREFDERVRRLAGVLAQFGVRAGDRVGVIDHDSHRYLEFFFAVPMIGAVLHTVNPRLSPEQLLFTLNHAEDRILFLHPDYLPLIEPLAGRLETIHHYVLMSDRGEEPKTALAVEGDYEKLLPTAAAVVEFPDFAEDTIATLFYTTGTTGDPKGVFFSHRQLVLHTLAAGFALGVTPDPCGFGYRDVYMPLTPMFHVHAWGVPYIATLTGVRQVYPGRYEPRMLLELIRRHRVTLSHCVPTLLQMLLHHPESGGVDLAGWKLIIGGSALPAALAKQAMDRGIRIAQGYGMSETCPIIALSSFKPGIAEAPIESRLDILARTGFPVPLVRARAMDALGRSLPAGAENVGELVLQAPWLTGGYFKQDEMSRALWENGWMHTGDLAYLDTEGYVRITDRLKDVIKIGGEWISSLVLESALGHHPAVREVAVIAIPDSKWDERPLALVALRDPAGHPASAKDLVAFLRQTVDSGGLHKRAILTHIEIVDTIPKTSVGKFDKKVLRAHWQSRHG
jgi:fatty-acyl-CoA synthase